MNIDSLKIELLLANAGITKAELANRCGFSRQNISVIIRRALANHAHWANWLLV